MIAMLVLLSVSIADSGSDYLILPPPVDFGIAPALPTVVDDLPDAFLGEHDSICYPSETFHAVGQWLDYAHAYPTEICQPVIDQVVIGYRMYADHKQAELDSVYKQKLAKLEVQQANKVEPWFAAVMALGAVMVGVAGGYLAGYYTAP